MDKTRVVLTDDNWADYFSLDYPESLVRGLAVGEGGVGATAGRSGCCWSGSPRRAGSRELATTR